MRHFDNIVSALVISGAACFAAVGCSATSGDAAGERTGDALQAQDVSADLNAPSSADPSQGALSDKAPALGQAGPSDLAPVTQAPAQELAPVTQAPAQELAPVTQAPSQGEFDKKQPQAPSQGEFNKKMPQTQAPEYAPVTQAPSKGEFNKKMPQAPIQGDFSKKLPSNSQIGGNY
jgi:hypothetical protein